MDKNRATDKNKPKKYSLTHIMLTYITIATYITIFIIGIAWITDTHNIYKKETKKLKEIQINSTKTELKERVDSIVDYINYRKTQTENVLKEDLKDRTYEAYDLMYSIYNTYKDTKSKEEITDMIVTALKDIRFNDGRGYYFIDSLDGDVIMYPIFPESQGSNLIDLQDANGNYVLQDEINFVLEQQEGYINGYWQKPNSSNTKTYRKITFVKAFEPYGWYLGCGDYVEDISKEIQVELLDYINGLQYGDNDSQYIFIHDFSGNELANGYYPEIIGTNNYELEDIAGIKVVQEQIEISQQEGGGFLTHHWIGNTDDTSSEKLTYVTSFSEWKWVIGTGQPNDQIFKHINEEELALTENVKSKIICIIFILLALMVTNLIITKVLVSILRKSINIFIEYITSSNAELQEIKPEDVEFIDLVDLVSATNSMTKRINNLIIHDELTTIYNRRFISSKLNELLDTTQPSPNNVSIILIDIDHFKRINDTYGHHIGDNVLIELTHIIETILPKDNYFGRFGGEEFLIIMPNSDKKTAVALGNLISIVIEQHTFDAVPETITISGGISSDQGRSGKEMISEADKNLYIAKNSGRNQIRY